MIGTQIITMAESLVDETIEETIALQLVNNKINEIEAERPWSFLTTNSISLTALSSDTYLTSKVIPTDCAVIKQLEVGNRIYEPIGLEQINKYKDIVGYYYIKSSNFYLCGSVNETKTITITYKSFSTEIIGSGTPSFPLRFQKMLGFFLAADFYIMDAGEKNISWLNELYAKGEMILNAMRTWDIAITVQNINTINSQKSNIMGRANSVYRDNVL